LLLVSCGTIEGDTVANWTFKGNEVSNNNYGPGKQNGDVWLDSCVPSWNSDGTPQFHGVAPKGLQPHSSVAILDNSFYQFSGQAAVSAQGVAGLHIHSNKVQWNPDGTAPKANFLTPDSTGVDITNNVCEPLKGAAAPCRNGADEQ
jgi:hypothetical protein